MNKSDKKIFATLFFSMFSAITGVGIVVPLLPSYAHDLGAGGLYIGMIFGAFSISRTFLLPYFGRRSDRKGRKPLIVTGLFAYSLVSVAFMFAETVESLIFIRFVQGGASAMIMPVVQAYIGDITPENREGVVMSLFNMSVFLGLSIGPLIGGVASDFFSLRFSFLCMGVLSLASFFLSLFTLPCVSAERSAAYRREKPSGWARLLRDKDITGLFAFRFGYTACIGIIWSFLPLFADLEFSLSSSPAGVLVMIGVFVSGLVQMPMGFLADRINKKAMVVAGGLMIIWAMISFEWATGFWGLFFASALFGLGGGTSMAPHTAIAVQKGNRSKAMGSVMALMTVSHSMGMMSGSLFAGLMMDMFELRQAFSFGSVVMICGVLLFIICTGCVARPDHRTSESRIGHHVRQARQYMAPLRLDAEPDVHPSAIAYFQYYGIHFGSMSSDAALQGGCPEQIRHFFGTFSSGPHTLAAHVFQPRDSKGTVFLLHGYFDHAGMLKHLIRHCLDQGFAVAVHDLPGHGLSGGERSCIGDFSEYVSAFDDFINICRACLPKPWHLIGHSTGSAIAFEYLAEKREKQVFGQIIFLAPLVRSGRWHLSKMAYYLVKPFVRTVPRNISETSCSPDFIEFLKNDPLQNRQISLKWLKALYAWNRRIKTYAPLSTPVLIVQGKNDTVVDWKYNLPFLKEKIRQTNIRLIEHSGHRLLNETKDIRSEVFGYVRFEG